MKGLGKGFADSIETFKIKRRKKDLLRPKTKASPFLFFYLLLLFLFWLIFIKIFELTIVKGEKNRQLSEGNRVKEERIEAPRGIVFDREGEVLVRNTTAYKDKTTGKILTHRQVIEMEAKGTMPEIDTFLVREYPYPTTFSHLLGYLGEISKEELEQNKKYRLGQLIGRTGLEQGYEALLKGGEGKKLIEVDAEGEAIKTLGQIDPITGRNLNLSVDLSLQKEAEKEMQGRKGAIVVSNPQTGEILTLYSSPTFDLSLLSFEPKGEKVSELFKDQNRPMFNRAISGTYPPGSTFKIITATAGLEENVIDEKTQVEDTGVIRIGAFSFPNWYFTQYGRTEGLVNVVTAIQRSNDIFFYKVGEWLGVEKLAEWGKRFSIGKALGIDLPGEGGGVMPDPSWREETRAEKWYLGDTYHLAIGQGDLLVTPLQVNSWTAVIANGGKLCEPRVVLEQNLKSECQDLGLKAKTVGLVKEGMRKTCEPGGTGWPLFKFKIKNENLKIDGLNFLEAEEATASGEPWVRIPTACKTGTAEFGDPEDKTHAWFTIFAPVEDPEIAVTVLVEEGGEGSNVAAPIAKKILEEWFGKENKK